MEISPLSSTVQNDATDLYEPIVGDCQHCPPYHTMMSIKVYPLILVMTVPLVPLVPLQSNEQN